MGRRDGGNTEKREPTVGATETLATFTRWGRRRWGHVSPPTEHASATRALPGGNSSSTKSLITGAENSEGDGCFNEGAFARDHPVATPPEGGAEERPLTRGGPQTPPVAAAHRVAG